jgi:hypothetical protein
MSKPLTSTPLQYAIHKVAWRLRTVEVQRFSFEAVDQLGHRAAHEPNWNRLNRCSSGARTGSP